MTDYHNQERTAAEWSAVKDAERGRRGRRGKRSKACKWCISDGFVWGAAAQAKANQIHQDQQFLLDAERAAMLDVHGPDRVDCRGAEDR